MNSEQSDRSSSRTSSTTSTNSAELPGRGRGRAYRPGTRHTHMAIVYPRTTSISTADLPVDNPLQLLRRYKTVFLVDDSNSMKKRNRWSETREALASLAVSAASYGLEGIDVHFLNSPKFGTDLQAEVKQLFDNVSPRGITMIATKLENLLADYLLRLEDARTAEVPTRVKPVNYIIITDGTSTDDPVPVIIRAARRLDEGSFPATQVGLQFIQIGSDPRATEALRRLDDDIHASAGVRDIVDTTPYVPGHRFSSDMVIKALLGGINRRVDKDGSKTNTDA
ncbi:hypothetical protein SCHPADRAFT_835231 [Schizopora paradoxa]|uniref:VWFA domain-containing protein n=1 Tax=Schizopora paradoxa TaxID=27342 RepID=A0A0H2R9K7_9AGAM|nr:hypothetical protein SCHPADRAFT_835231 [Schizopora paradoxa]